MDFEKIMREVRNSDAGKALKLDGENERLRSRVAQLEAALHKINALIDNPNDFNQAIQDVLDSVIDTSDTRF